MTFYKYSSKIFTLLNKKTIYTQKKYHIYSANILFLLFYTMALYSCENYTEANKPQELIARKLLELDNPSTTRSTGPLQQEPIARQDLYLLLQNNPLDSEYTNPEINFDDLYNLLPMGIKLILQSPEFLDDEQVSTELTNLAQTVYVYLKSDDIIQQKEGFREPFHAIPIDREESKEPIPYDKIIKERLSKEYHDLFLLYLAPNIIFEVLYRLHQKDVSFLYQNKQDETEYKAINAQALKNSKLILLLSCVYLKRFQKSTGTIFNQIDLLYYFLGSLLFTYNLMHDYQVKSDTIIETITPLFTEHYQEIEDIPKEHIKKVTHTFLHTQKQLNGPQKHSYYDHNLYKSCIKQSELRYFEQKKRNFICVAAINAFITKNNIYSAYNSIAQNFVTMQPQQEIEALSASLPSELEYIALQFYVLAS